MEQQDIDYDALAKEHGGTASKVVDYDALAAQHGGTAIKASKASAPASVDYDALAKEHGGATSGITDPETKAAVARLKDNPIEGATFSAAPSTWESLKTAVAHPINYLKEVEEDTQEGGGRTIVGRTLGHMQHGSMDDTGYTADKTGIAPIMAGPIQGPPKVVRGALRIIAPPDASKTVGSQIKEEVGGLNELVGGAMQTPGAAIAVIDPAFLPKVAAGGIAQHYAEKGLTALGVPNEYAELGGNVAGVLGAHALEDPSLLIRGAAKTTDAIVGKPVRGAFKKLLPDAAAPAIEEHIHVPGRTVGLEPSEKALGSLNAEVDAARERLRIAEKKTGRAPQGVFKTILQSDEASPVGNEELVPSDGLKSSKVQSLSDKAGLKTSNTDEAEYQRAKKGFQDAVERQAVAEENIPFEKSETDKKTLPLSELSRTDPRIETRDDVLKSGSIPSVISAYSPSEYAERWRTPEKKADYYGRNAISRNVVFGEKKPNVPYIDRPVLRESDEPVARSASDELIPRDIANVISSKPQSIKGASSLGKIALPTDEQPAPRPTNSPLGRIEAVIPEAKNIISNVEEKAHQFGTTLPAESTDTNTSQTGMKPIDLSRLEPLLNQTTGGRPLEPNTPLREQGSIPAKPVAEEKLSSDPRKAVLQKAGAAPEEITTILQRGSRFDPTSKVGLSKLAEHFGVDLGDSAIGRGKSDVAAGTHLPPHEVLQRIIDAGHTPAEIVKAINEGKHLPPIGGGSQGADAAPVFYSKAERTVNDKVSTGSGDSILSTLRNNGVKESEIQWMGLDDYLKGKAKVSKADVQQFIANNKIELKEVNLGGESHEQLKQLQDARNGVYAENNRIWADNLRNAPHSTELFNAMQDGDPESVIAQMPKNLQEPARNFVVTDNLLRNYDKAIDKMSKRGADKAPHYSAYTLPGEKSNYTEKLLTLPEENDLPRLREEYDAANTERTKYLQTLRPVPGDVELRFHDAQEAVRKAENASKPFRTAHYPDEPNVLAHVRYDDRTTTDGKKVLLLEEAQSDWHMQGKKQGYQNPAPTKLPDGVYIVPDNGYFSVVSREGNPLLNRTYGTEQGAREAALEHYGEGAGNKGVPDAPFKTDWHELAMKRMLREAAEKGYDRLAWVTGDQTAARYDLSKHIDSLDWLKHADGTVSIAATKNGEEVFRKDDLTPEELSDHVGKDVANKIQQSEGKNYRMQGTHNMGTLKGLDLKVGGDWARSLYDQAIVNFMNKYTKKWGGKVGESEITTHATKPFNEFSDQHLRAWPESTPEEVRNAHKTYNQGATEKVHSLDINEKMRKSLLETGQPISKGFKPILPPKKSEGFGRIDVAA